MNNPFRYSGYEYDSGSGLYYLKSRHYDPVIARFMQEDTYRGSINDPLSLNLYSYANNKPVMYYDPNGHFGVVIGLAIAISMKATLAALKKSSLGSSDSSSSSNALTTAFDAMALGFLAIGLAPLQNTNSNNSVSTQRTYSGISVEAINISLGYQVSKPTGQIGSTSIEITANGVVYKIYEGTQYYLSDGNAYYYNNESNAVRALAEAAGYSNIMFSKMPNGLWGSTISIPGITDKKGTDMLLREGIDYYRDSTGKAYYFDSVRTLTEGKGQMVTNASNARSTISVSNKTQPLVFGQDYYISSDGKAFFTQGIPTPGWLRPTSGRFTDGYGARSGAHYGQDIANGRGTDIVAMKDGVVLKVMETYTPDEGRGKYLYIDHGNGYRALYQHNDSNMDLKVGDQVKQGQVIAKMGNTGKGGFHLHVELYENIPNDKYLNSMSPEAESRKYTVNPASYWR